MYVCMNVSVYVSMYLYISIYFSTYIHKNICILGRMSFIERSIHVTEEH